MKNKTAISIFVFITNLLTASVSLEIHNVDIDAGTLDIYMTNLEPVGGFQFDILGTTLGSASGGLAADAGFTVSTGDSTILGFSFTGSVILRAVAVY